MTHKSQPTEGEQISSLSEIAERLREVIRKRIESGEYDGLGNRGMDEDAALDNPDKPLQE
jgi:hypothetical protein